MDTWTFGQLFNMNVLAEGTPYSSETLTFYLNTYSCHLHIITTLALLSKVGTTDDEEVSGVTE